MEFSGALVMFNRGHHCIMLLFTYEKSKVKDDFFTCLVESSCGWHSILCSREQTLRWVTFWVLEYLEVSQWSELKAQGSVSYFGSWKLSVLLQSKKATKEIKSQGDSCTVDGKIECFNYAELRNASCPVIKYLTFYLFIWLAELAFLAFLVGLYCWGFFFFFFFGSV